MLNACNVTPQADARVRPSTPTAAVRDHLEGEGQVEVASNGSGTVSSAGSSASEGAPVHLESGNWRFEAPNLILDAQAGKVFPQASTHTWDGIPSRPLPFTPPPPLPRAAPPSTSALRKPLHSLSW